MVRLFVLLMLAVFAVNAGAAGAQGAFPAPLPGQTAPSADVFRFAPPPSGGPSEACMKGFMPLREEAEKRGKLIKSASDRHAPPDEACRLIGAYSQAEIKMIKFVESHAAQCGIPPQVADQLKNGHKSTDALEKKVCGVAQQQAQQRGPAGPSLSDVLGSAAALPGAPLRRCGPQEHFRDDCAFEMDQM
jgi:hypothetical protein